MMNPTNKRRILIIGGAILLFLLYAYAVSVTRINLEEPLEPRRQENLIGLIRALARPDLFVYDTETRATAVSMHMPCPEEIKGSQVSIEGRTLLLVPNCVNTTQDNLTLTGQGFSPNASGIVRWYPPGATTTRVVSEFKADADGTFSTDFTMPDVRETDEAQQLEVVEVLSRRITGISDTTTTAVARIFETIFMALLASTFGSLLAIPLSFLGARNVMAPVSSPLAAIMAGIILFPLGWFAGYELTGGIGTLANQINSQSGTGGTFLGLIVCLGGIFALWRWQPPNNGGQAGSLLRLGLLGLLGLLAAIQIAILGALLGQWLVDVLGLLGFLGNFILILSQFILIFLSALVGFVMAVAALSFGNRVGQEAILRLPGTPSRLLTGFLSAVGTAVFIFILGYFLNWLYQFENPIAWTLLPALVGGGVVGLAALLIEPKRPWAIGMLIYSITRTLLNVMRAIEPVILGFVFVVWVGIGPMAGILALMLHSIADLGKLFSEQVENIDEGPVEAVTATGANRTQTIVYAVVPQVVPHYIAFIFYRWDINVRMSTIIGFVGGGGIGLVLQRFTNLTQYRQASVLIIAIALVVTILDYASSRIRRRIT